MLGTGARERTSPSRPAEHGYIGGTGISRGRFDGYVLRTTDGGHWRPQAVASRFLSKVAAAGRAHAPSANEGTAIFANRGATANRALRSRSASGLCRASTPRRQP